VIRLITSMVLCCFYLNPVDAKTIFMGSHGGPGTFLQLDGGSLYDPLDKYTHSQYIRISDT